MYRNYIDKLVWYIPFKKLRDLIRNILLEYFYKLEFVNEHIALLDFRLRVRNSISQLPKNIVKETRNPRLIVTLTSYPERMETIDVVLYSLLDQTLKPDKIVLWLSYEEFPNLEDDVPSNILDMKKYGIEIEFCHNIRSYKKLVYSLKKYPNDLLVTCDDDIYYQRNWLKLLYNSYLENPNVIHCHRGLRISYDNNHKISRYLDWNIIKNIDDENIFYKNFFTAGAGIICKKDFFYEDIFNEELFMRLSPTEDDMWFWAMAVLNGTKINVVKNNMADLKIVSLYNYSNLCEQNVHVNNKIFADILDYYGDKLKDKIFNDN
ncbi:hypothetical protein [Brachyspira pulli]|uniref:hypothetical protein n=1 Tax=Brachyspira pulli TaxID=310721 RepID=UPI003004589D